MHSAFEFMRRQLRLLGQLVWVSQKVAPLPDPDFFRTFSLALRLFRDALFTPEEAYRRGMLDLARSSGLRKNHISKNKLKSVQRALNPGSWTRVTEDKSIFYKYCMALGVPIPGLYALFFRGRAGWSHTGAALRNRDDWIDLLRKHLPEEFVIKPAWGVFGCGVRIFSRAAEALYSDAGGEQLGPEELYDTVLVDPRYHTMIIQERLTSHPVLEQLSDTRYLQTVRVHTFIDGSNVCHIIYAFLKPISGGNFMDNHDLGRTGNLVASIDLNTGRLIGATINTMDGSGAKAVPWHPETGNVFEGFQMPLWQEVCQLAEETAYNFLPLRTVGWDIAITPNGVRVIEGNAWSDPHGFAGAEKILGSMRID